MSYEKTPDGGYAEKMDEHHAQPHFLGVMGLVLAALAVLFGIMALISGLNHPAVF